MPFQKYKSIDQKCMYPFSNEPLGYCWSYACFRDYLDGIPGNEKFANIIAICQGCSCYKDSPNYDPNSY